MKIMIVGLGNFGSALAVKLNRFGHEVIGIDRSRHKTESIKDFVNTVVTMDITEKPAIAQLPINDMDVIVISIGENLGDSVIATALLKDYNAKRIICRAISETHFNILEKMGIDHIITPEVDAANNSVSTVLYEMVHSAYVISDNYKVCEMFVPERFLGLKVSDLTFNNYNIQLLLIRKAKGKLHPKYMMKVEFDDLLPSEIDYVLSKDDLLVVFGLKKNIDKYASL
ncbi:MAG: TrkA family potassium uptake protein [Bacteroidales bacterium]|nr:TrkA family potassium uptake protein [Bacteroidales bacterium]